MVLPNTFILGAPKCGTTSLCRWMSSHENIFLPKVKEPHFFNTDGLRGIEDVSEYQSLYATVSSEHKVICDGSTHYLFSCDAVGNIMRVCPNPKFIVCLRNPVEMAPSLYSERVWGGREHLPTFGEAWRAQSRRLSGELIPHNARRDPLRLQYGEYCKLGAQLERLYEQVDPLQVHLILLDDLKKSPDIEYRKLMAFLDLPYSHIDYEEYNQRKSVKSIKFAILIRRVRDKLTSHGFARTEKFVSKLRAFNNSNDRSSSQLSPQLKKELQDYFKEDIKTLSDLLNRDLSFWLR